MRNLKRVLSLALALVMVLGMMVITTSAADFTDAEEITYTEAVEVMSALGILKGYEDGSFKPEGTLNRQEAAKIIAFVCMGTEADEYLTGSTVSFTDVEEGHWAAKYIAFCKNAKIVDGVNDAKTLFNPTGTLTTVQFAKMLLGALGIEGEFTGAGWEEAVKDAVAKVGTMNATGIKIDNSDITREEACELALAAMKHGEEYSYGYYYEGEEGFGYAATYSEMYIMAKTMLEGETPAFDKDNIKKHKDTKNTLLGDMYDVKAIEDEDEFGRPGVRYVGITAGNEFDMFYADEALAKFEGPVAEKDIFAAAKVTDKDLEQIPYTIIQDGVDISNWGTWTADKEVKNTQNNAKNDAAGTGYGIKSELYVEVVEETPVYTLVSIREYLGKVTDVTPADEEDEESKRTIEVTVYNLPADNDMDGKVTLETEDYAEDDMVIVTVAGNKIQTIAAVKSISGTPTKLVDGVVTIAGTEYVASQNAYGVSYTLGKAGSWYVDSFGNLLGTVPAAETPKAAEYYGILKAVDGKLYIAAGQAETLLGEGSEGQEAAEVVQILTSEGKTVIFDTAWKYLYEDETDETKITGVEYINGAAVTDDKDTEETTDDVTSYVPTVSATDRLVKYTLDANGKVKTIALAGTAKTADGQLNTGKAVLGAGYDKVVTDSTLFFLKVDDKNANTTDKYVAYTGYKNVPTVAFTNTAYVVEGKTATGASDGTYAVVVIDGEAVAPQAETPVYSYIYFADTAYTEQWNAEANEGEGAVEYVYENVYLNGEKTTVTFAAAQTKAAKGALYAYTVNAKTGALNILWNNLVVETDVVTLIHADFFKTTDVHYVDADTVYYQISKTGLTKVEALPTVKTTESIYVKYILSNVDAEGNVTTANTVYFVVDTKGKELTAPKTVTTAAELAAAEGKVVLTANIPLTGLLTITNDVTIDLNGFEIARADGTALYINGGDVTIQGNGTVTAKSGAVYVNDGTVTINGGTYVGLDNAAEPGTIIARNGSKVVINNATVDTEEIAVRTFAGAEVTINGGEFTSALHTIFACEGSKVTVNAGTFNPAEGYEEIHLNDPDYCDNCDVLGILVDNRPQA